MELLETQLERKIEEITNIKRKLEAEIKSR
jgi:hypothetical protein